VRIGFGWRPTRGGAALTTGRPTPLFDSSGVFKSCADPNRARGNRSRVRTDACHLTRCPVNKSLGEWPDSSGRYRSLRNDADRRLPRQLPGQVCRPIALSDRGDYTHVSKFIDVNRTGYRHVIEELNRIRNSDFSTGQRRPRSWNWQSNGQVRWQWVSGSGNGQAAGMTLRCEDPRAFGGWQQRFRCKSEQYYRIEVLVTCDLQLESDAAGGAGLCIAVTLVDRDGESGETVALPPLHRAKKSVVRGYFQTPKGSGHLSIRIGLRGATGTAVIHDVRVIEVLDPEMKSHPLAVPPPPYAQAPPRRVRSLRIVTDTVDRELVSILRRRFGDSCVHACAYGDFRATGVGEDAVIFTSDTLPSGCRSMSALKKLAEKRIVIINPAALASVSRGKVAVRTITQIDDPLNARVVDSNFITQAFALHDMLPFAHAPDTSTTMRQRQFRRNGDYKAFREKHQLVEWLEAMTDAERTSEKPIALYSATTGGALIVMDVEPVESVVSTMDEPVAAVQLLLSALGASDHGAGQYVDPARTQRELRYQLVDLVARFDELRWHGDRPPRDLHQPALIHMGRELHTDGLRPKRRPVILLRTGLTGADIEGLYTVMLWLKHLLRPAPFVSPYAQALNSRCALMWLPLCAATSAWGGWQPSDATPMLPEVEFAPGTIEGVIDLTTTRQHSVNVLTPTGDSFADTLADVLPAVAKSMITGRHFYHAVETGVASGDRQACTWRMDDLRPVVSTSDHPFQTELHQRAQQAGAHLIRLELPTTGYVPSASSIWRSDWGATLLEQIVGLLLGFVAVNRRSDPVRIAWPASLNELVEHAVLRRINHPSDHLDPDIQNGKLTLPAGHAVIALNP